MALGRHVSHKQGPRQTARRAGAPRRMREKSFSRFFGFRAPGQKRPCPCQIKACLFFEIATGHAAEVHGQTEILHVRPGRVQKTFCRIKGRNPEPPGGKSGRMASDAAPHIQDLCRRSQGRVKAAQDAPDQFRGIPGRRKKRLAVVGQGNGLHHGMVPGPGDIFDDESGKCCHFKPTVFVARRTCQVRQILSD